MTWIATGVSIASAAYQADQQSEAESEAERRTDRSRRREGARQDQINRRTQLINRAFESPEREAGYEQYAQALRGILGQQLERRKGERSRQRKFDIARRGQTGGSVDADTRQRLGEQFERAALETEQQAREGVFELRDADEEARRNLIRMARGGQDATTGRQRALTSQQTNLAGAMQDAQSERLGDVFSATAETNRRIRERGAFAEGFNRDRRSLYGRTV